MNFFDDQLMLDSPLKMSKKNSNVSSKFPPRDNSYIPSSSHIASKSNIPKDSFDDLLSNMEAQMDKKKNNSRSRERQSSSREISYSPSRERNKDFSKTVTAQNKWNTGFQGLNENSLATQVLPKNQQRGGPLNSARSNHEDMYSDDGRSMQSGITGKNSAAFQKASITGFDLGSGNRRHNIIQADASLPPTSSMRSMRGPLRKKDSRDQSVINDEVIVSTNFGNQISSVHDLQGHLPPKPPRRNQTNQTQQSHNQRQNDDYPKANLFNNFAGNLNQTPLRNFDLSISGDKNAVNSAKQKIIEKVIYVKQENKQIKQQHQKQLNMIKSSHQRQLKFLQQNLDKQTAAHKRTRIQLIKQSQVSLQNQKKQWKKIEQQNVERIKSLNEWEHKKKDQTHRMQIQRLKSLLQQATRFSQDYQNLQSQGMTKQQIKDKERQIQRQRKRLMDYQNTLKIRQNNIQIRQIDFQNLRKRQQDHIQHQKKKLYELESQVKRQQIQIKRNMNFQRQSMASQLANAQLQVQKKRSTLKLQKQQLSLEKQFFERQKVQMQQFNKKILEGYRIKIKEIQQEKQKVHNLEVQLYKKIHTVELMGAQTGVDLKNTQGFKLTNIKFDVFSKQVNFTKENFKDQSNQLQEKLRITKQRFAKMQEWTRNNTGNNKTMTDRARATTNLDSYLLRMNRGNPKIKKDYF